jgi:hypothetical protein
MIERHWKAVTKRQSATEEPYFYSLGMSSWLSFSATILERDTEDGTEFLIITQWQISPTDLE